MATPSLAQTQHLPARTHSGLGAFCRTVAHLRPHQVWVRLGMRLKQKWYASFLYDPYADLSDVLQHPQLKPPLLGKVDKNLGKNILGGAFTFAGRTIHMSNEKIAQKGVKGKTSKDQTIRWLPHEASALWVYHLHYFDWLKHLYALGDDGREHAAVLLNSWLKNFSRYHPVVWHPYPLSLRLVSWLSYADWLLAHDWPELHEKFMAALYAQANHLPKVLEWDVGGNHLLKNIKALIYIGLCLPNRQSDYLNATDMLLEQLKIQILPDGCHYERSPHYHVEVLWDLIEIKALLRKSGQSVPPALEIALENMLSALAFFRLPDGTLPLFNDGSRGDPALMAFILKYCNATGEAPEKLPDAGYYKLERGNMSVMIDAGLCCPNDLPAHAHADMLSFEVFSGKQPVFVNGGTYAYQHKLRNIFRGTAAHNTVVVNNENSAEVYGNFRLGRRPKDVQAQVLQEAGTGIGLQASHDGYRHRGVLHERRMFLDETGSDLRGEDLLTCKNKRKAYPVMAYFHLAPGIKCHVQEDKQAELFLPDGERFIFKISGGRLDKQKSHYSPHFGELQETSALFIRAKLKEGACRLHWALKKGGSG